MIEFKHEAKFESGISSHDGTIWKVIKELNQVQIMKCDHQGERTKSIQKVMSAKLSDELKEKYKKLMTYNPSELVGFSLSIPEFARFYLSDDFKDDANENNKTKEKILNNEESKVYIIPKKQKRVTFEQNEQPSNDDKIRESKKMKI